MSTLNLGYSLPDQSREQALRLATIIHNIEGKPRLDTIASIIEIAMLHMAFALDHQQLQKVITPQQIDSTHMPSLEKH